MIFILSKVPPRLSYDQPDPHTVDVESELQHTLLKAAIPTNQYIEFGTGSWIFGPIWIRIQGYVINFERKI